MSPTLALPAAKLGLSLAGSLVNGLSNALDPATAKAKKQADDFETMFLEQVTQQLTAAPSGSEGPLGENGIGGDIYKSQLTQEYAKQIQKAGGIGLSDSILRDLLRLQEQSGAAQSSGA
ncbi:MAG: rod-binding protein [Bosea sp. (in: a-proteobacteria)]|uniref:rod-binding protein n=1 Tax=Bosea sp. (in: a-proteobacteria) TaxID=1871050 RepID=UPI002732E961|nr:rod-binding protein [Bosea sp. (in: a-proteobacteria)]MDP3258442.1 rod-binding protein [Bosea sp. (in: a-proteobacteria)]MDP3321325.1 rod-binding protein [Bosea sp. (in: a-proteobacteria)]